MPKQRFVALADLGSVAINTPGFCGDLEFAQLFVTGTFVGTAVVEASGDGTNYAPVAAGLTAPGIVTLPSGAQKARLNVTSWTSGTIKSHIAGRDDDRAG
jgi:hypothetical protein